MSEINLAFLFGAVFGMAVGYVFRVWWRFVRWLWTTEDTDG